MRGAAAILCASLLCLGWSPAAAAEPDDQPQVVEGLSAQVHPVGSVPRRDAPWPLTIGIDWRGRSLRQGTLQVLVREGGQPLCFWESDLRVLSPESTSQINVLMPPFPLSPIHDQLDLVVSFRDQDRTINLGGPTIAEGTGAHTLVLGLCLPLDGSGVGRLLSQALSFNRPVPEGGDYQWPGKQYVTMSTAGLRTVPVQLRDEELPETPLGWCAVDAVAIAGNRLATLRPRQVQALQRWIDAGGSCCLATSGTPPTVLAPLLAHAGVSAVPPAADHVRVHVGLGRLIIAPLPDEQSTGSQAWRASAAFLWKLRCDIATSYTSGTGLQELLDQLIATQNERDETHKLHHGPRLTAAITAYPLNLHQGLTELLWPKQAAVIPIWVIIVTFLAFVVAVGPMDWFVLGWLRAHRFTWVLFPVLAIASTWTTVAIAQHYLGSRSHHAVLELVDLGAGDAVLRRNRIELVFNGTGGTQVETHDQSIWSQMGADQTMYAPATGRRTRARSQAFDDRLPVHSSGAIPAHFTVDRTIEQWTPVLSRELSCEPFDLPWRLSLDRITDQSSVKPIADAWLAGGAATRAVIAYHGLNEINAWGSDLAVDPQMANATRNPNSMPYQLSQHSPQGWFALAMTESPAGGGTYDDFQVYDPSDPDAFLVIFVERTEGTLWMVRRVFHVPPRAPTPTRSAP